MPDCFVGRGKGSRMDLIFFN